MNTFYQDHHCHHFVVFEVLLVCLDLNVRIEQRSHVSVLFTL